MRKIAIIKKSLIVLLLLFSSTHTTLLHAQEPSSFTWENRLLLILVSDLQNPNFKAQLTELKAHSEGLEERKLLIYMIQPNKYKIGIQELEWQESTTLFDQYKKTKAPLEIVLIGLDGGKKLQRTTFLSCKELFATIDAMPMRKFDMP